MKRSIAWVVDHEGVVLAVSGGLVLVVSLWLPWFVASPVCAQPLGVPCPRVVHYSAWDSFRVAHAVLAALAAATIVLALAGPPVGTRLAPLLGLEPSLGRALARLGVAAAGWAALCLSLYAIHRPNLPLYPGRVPDWGYLIALLACGAILAGGWWEHRTDPRR